MKIKNLLNLCYFSNNNDEKVFKRFNIWIRFNKSKSSASSFNLSSIYSLKFKPFAKFGYL